MKPTMEHLTSKQPDKTPSKGYRKTTPGSSKVRSLFATPATHNIATLAARLKASQETMKEIMSS